MSLGRLGNSVVVLPSQLISAARQLNNRMSRSRSLARYSILLPSAHCSARWIDKKQVKNVGTCALEPELRKWRVPASSGLTFKCAERMGDIRKKKDCLYPFFRHLFSMGTLSSPRHLKARAVVQSGLFDRLTSFLELEQRIVCLSAPGNVVTLLRFLPRLILPP